MTRHSFEDLGNVRFEWPEPLVIDLISELYRDIAQPADRLMIARLQQSALRELFEGEARRSGALRLNLIAACAARGIGPERIAQADRVVFWELIKVVTTQYRTSPRSRAQLAERLHAALGRLAAEDGSLRTPGASPQPRRTLAARMALA